MEKKKHWLRFRWYVSVLSFLGFLGGGSIGGILVEKAKVENDFVSAIVVGACAVVLAFIIPAIPLEFEYRKIRQHMV